MGSPEHGWMFQQPFVLDARRSTSKHHTPLAKALTGIDYPKNLYEGSVTKPGRHSIVRETLGLEPQSHLDSDGWSVA